MADFTSEARRLAQGTCGFCGINFQKEVRRYNPAPKYCSGICRKRGKAAAEQAEKDAAATALEKRLNPYGLTKERQQIEQLLRSLPKTNAAATKNMANIYRTPKQRIPDVKKSAPKRDQFAVVCPHPYKLPYRTFEEAQAFIDRVHQNDEFIAPYKCKCGGVHIGHSYPRNHPLHPANRRKQQGAR